MERGFANLVGADKFSLAVLISSDGTPVAYSTTRDDVEADNLRKIMVFMREACGDVVYMADKASGPHVHIDECIVDGTDFIIPYPATYSGVRDFVRRMESEAGPRTESNGSILRECTAGISLMGGKYGLSIEGDPGFDGSATQVKAFLSYDARANRKASETARSMIRGIKGTLNGMDSPDPRGDFERVAGFMSRVLRLESNEDGTMKVVVDRMRMNEFYRNAGKTLVISTRASWEEIEALLNGRMRLSKAMGVLFERPSRSEHDGVLSVSGGMFLSFVALSLYSGLADELEKRGIDAEVLEVLSVLSTLKVIQTPSGHVLGSVSRDVSSILEGLGITPDDIRLRRQGPEAV